MQDKKPLILILSRNYSNGLAVARMLGSVGYTVDMIASSHKEGASDVAACSKYIRNFSEVVSRKVGNAGEEELLQAILEHKGTDGLQPILIPTDDYTTTVMDNNRDALASYFVMPSLEDRTAGALAHLQNKTLQAELAKKVGLLVPEYWTFDLREEFIIPDDMIYPCYVKPITSITGYKTEMAVCEDAEALVTHLGKMRERFEERTVLVQEYLKIDYEFASAGLCLDQHVILPGMIRKTRIGKHGTGVTLTGELVSNDMLGEGVAEKAMELLRSFHYTGMFGMEFAVVGDRIYFNEVNLRSAGESFAYYHNGVNLAELYIKGLLGETFPEADEKMREYGKTFIYDKIAWEDYVYGYLTKEELEECINSVDYTILVNADDPEPGRLFVEKQTAAKAQKDKNQERRERCINAILENTDWTREEAEAQLDDARRRLGIKYNHYRHLKLWDIPVEEQEAAYNNYLATRDLSPKDPNKPLVVVLSRNYATGLSIVRSLGAAGFTIDLVASTNKEENSKITAASKYVRNNTEVLSGKNNELGKRQLCDVLLKYRGLIDKPVLFPVDDYTAAVTDEFKEELESVFIMPSIDGGNGSIISCMDKTYQESIAREAGMNVPQSWTFDLREEVIIPEDMIYPCFCKPLESFTGNKTDMARCDNEEELANHLAGLKIKESKRSIMVQEFLNIDDEIDFSGLCLDDKVIIPAIIRKTRVAEHEKGVTLAGRVHPYEELDEALRNNIAETLKKLHYFGMFDMELNIVGDKIYFNEINLRSGGPNYAYFMSGVNLPAIFVKEALGLGHNEEEEQATCYGKNFVYDKVAWEDYAHLYLSRGQLKKLFKQADFKLLDVVDDPEPGKLFLDKIEEDSKKTRKKERSMRIRLALRPILGPVKRIIFRYPQTKPQNRRDPKGEKPRVLVIGRNYCSNLCMAKSLGEAGYDVEVLRVYQAQTRITDIMRNIKPDAFSKSVKAYYICVTGRKPMALINRLIEIADKRKKMLIIPVDDLVQDIIDENMELLRDYYLLPNIDNTPGKISKLMDKGYQKQLAKDFGLKVVNSCVIRTEKGKYKIPDTVSYPCFIKPNISKNASKKRIRKCENEIELRAALSEFSLRKDIEMIVEDYVEIDKEYSLLGLSTTEDSVGPGFFVAEIGGQNEHRGVALQGRVLAVEEYQELIDQLVAFVKTLRFNGLWDIDLIQAKDGTMYFVEINMRYGASGYAITKCGVNLPAMFCDYMFYAKPIDTACHLTTSNKTFVSDKVVIDEYRMDRITWNDVKFAMNNADIYFIKDDNDKRPYNHFKKHFIEARRLRNIDRKMQADEE